MVQEKGFVIALRVECDRCFQLMKRRVASCKSQSEDGESSKMSLCPYTRCSMHPYLLHPFPTSCPYRALHIPTISKSSPIGSSYQLRFPISFKTPSTRIMFVTSLYYNFVIFFWFVTYFKDTSFDRRFSPLQCPINNVPNKVLQFPKKKGLPHIPTCTFFICRSHPKK